MQICKILLYLYMLKYNDDEYVSKKKKKRMHLYKYTQNI